jgi:hypothetical protein
MKRKSLMILFIVTVAFAFTFVPAKSHAAITQGFHDVNIVSAGPFFGKIIMIVDATNGSFKNQWLILDAEMQNSLLATALSGISLQQEVRVWVMADSVSLPGITAQTCYSILLK